MPTETGTAISNVRAVRNSVFRMNKAAPKCSSSGVQFREKKNSTIETSLKVRIAVLPIKKITIASTKHSIKMLSKK
ncbi:hypothetical protein D3C80_1614090 [compost metagenome]